MNTLKEPKKRDHAERIKEISKRLIEKVTDFIPYNYVSRVKAILERNNSHQLNMEGINRRIHQVRKGDLGNYEIAKALYSIGLEEKRKLEELEILADSE
jgi:muconolactone delta-isomerase